MQIMLKTLLLTVLTVIIICTSSSLYVSAETSPESTLIPERRKEQFNKSFGYAVFPYPYSLPGIGSGVGLVGGAMNIADTYADVYGIVFTGDVDGHSIGLGDIHIIPRRLILDCGYGAISRATIQSYSQRGMDSDKDDYRLVEFGDTEYYGARMTATFLDRRLEAYGAYYAGGGRLKSIRDRQGNIIIESQNSPREYGHTEIVGGRIDLTDDYADPRRGIRFEVTRSHSPPRDSGPDYSVMDYNTTAFLPLGKRSTWAFNYFRSDAVVDRQGITASSQVEDQMGVHCSTISDMEKRRYCEQVVNNRVAENTYGTAASLGGFSRLRAYSQGRYKGAHALFYASEIRWNLTDESTPFNLIFIKDIRTAVQVAAFYEIGSVADDQSRLGDTMRDAYGLGLRVVTASGVVFRGDIGFGREGVSPAIFIGYPWEI